MKQIFLLFIMSFFIGLCSCGSENRSKSSDWNPDDYKKVYLRDLNTYAYVPKFFVYKNPIEYMKMALAQGADETIMRSYKELADNSVGYEIYVDSTAFESSIIFYESEFTPIQNVGVSVVAGHLDKNFMDDDGTNNFYKLIDKKYIRTKKRELLKLKYEANIMDRYLYHTIYLITSNYRTIYVDVSSPGMGQDYQQLFEHIHLLRK